MAKSYRDHIKPPRITIHGSNQQKCNEALNKATAKKIRTARLSPIYPVLIKKKGTAIGKIKITLKGRVSEISTII